ncbi:unnamed protein product [Eretmochelys imbricata]
MWPGAAARTAAFQPACTNTTPALGRGHSSPPCPGPWTPTASWSAAGGSTPWGAAPRQQASWIRQRPLTRSRSNGLPPPASRLPFPLSYFASAALHNKLYLIGGKKHVAGALATHRGLLIYHVRSDSWAQVPLGVGLCHAGAAAMAGGICVVGGCRDEAPREEREGASCLGNFQASRACFFLGEDGKVRQEVAIPALPRAIESAGAVRWRGRVYVVGGEDSARWLNTVYYWEPSAAAWTPCREGPAAGEGAGWFGCVALQVPRRRLRALFQGQPTAPAAGGATGRKQLTCRTSAMAPPPVSGKGGLMCPSTAPGSDQGSPLA